MTIVKQLNDSERVSEIAQFLAGNEITEQTMSVAQEMLSERK